MNRVNYSVLRFSADRLYMVTGAKNGEVVVMVSILAGAYYELENLKKILTESGAVDVYIYVPKDYNIIKVRALRERLADIVKNVYVVDRTTKKLCA